MSFLGKVRFIKPAEAIWRTGEAFRTLSERIVDHSKHGFHDGRLADDAYLVPSLTFPSLQDIGRTVEFWRLLFPDSIQRDLDSATSILNNRIPLFSDVVDYGKAIDWHLDPYSNSRSPKCFYRDIETLDSEVAGDVKHIWELNRCNFLVTLGRAYAATGERKYYDAWLAFIHSWIESNPYNIGVNWKSSLEISFRTINWLWSWLLFSGEIEQDEESMKLVFQSLYLHGRHIERHLSYYFSPNTHLLGEALGLLYLGVAFPGFRHAGRWITTAEDILENELRKQILPDGGYFEMATYYHKYTIDFYLHYLMLSSRPGEETRSIIQRSVRHLALLAEPDGTIPLMGDSDGGRILPLSPNKKDIMGTCSAAAVLLNDGELKDICSSTFGEEALWLLGGEGKESFEKLPRVSAGKYHSMNKETGQYGFRMGMSGEYPSIIIDCGEHGWKGCGHAHSDLLSFVLYGSKGSVITDPGTFTYSGSKEIRDESRSSMRHNTITINEISQSEPGATFRWRSIASPRNAFCRVSGELGYFEGEHDAYDHLECRHKRTVLYLGGRLIVIIDLINASAPPISIDYNLQFGDGTLEDRGNDAFIFTRDRSQFFVRFAGGSGMDISTGESDIYPDYHLAIKAPRLQLKKQMQEKEFALITMLSEQEGLLDSISFDGKGKISGEHAGFSAEIEFSCPSYRMLETSISALVRLEDVSFILLRNSNEVVEVKSGLMFGTMERASFIAARLEGRKLDISVDDQLNSLKYPGEIDSVTVNGTPVAFDSTENLITFRGPL